MGASKKTAGRRSKRTTTHPAKKTITVQSLRRHNVSTATPRKRSWTRDQLTDANYLKVPATVWKNIHDPTRTEWLDGAANTLTPALAAGALLSRPNIGLVKVHKWFWNKSIATAARADTYRYRVMDQATDDTILPEDEWYDPVEDDETKVKILFVGLPFRDHLILLLRRICPDAGMDPIRSADEWRRYLSPSIRQGFTQIKKSTTYGWAPVNKRKKGRRT